MKAEEHLAGKGTKTNRCKNGLVQEQLKNTWPEKGIKTFVLYNVVGR